MTIFLLKILPFAYQSHSISFSSLVSLLTLLAPIIVHIAGDVPTPNHLSSNPPPKWHDYSALYSP